MVSKVIVLVRNPFDCLDSWWNMSLTSHHARSVDPAVYSQWRDLWDTFVSNELRVWCRFHRFWLDLRDRGRVHAHFVRYEDLLTHRGPVDARAAARTLSLPQSAPVLRPGPPQES